MPKVLLSEKVVQGLGRTAASSLWRNLIERLRLIIYGARRMVLTPGIKQLRARDRPFADGLIESRELANRVISFENRGRVGPARTNAKREID